MLEIDKPRDGDIHTLTDFAEILCLVTSDRICSRESIVDQAHDLGGHRITDIALDDCFNQLLWRTTAYGAHYPFKLDPRGRTIQATEDLTDKQKLYALMLLCANLPFFKVNTGPLTEAFERVSYLALKAIWPTKGVTRAFGKNTTEYTGAKWERLNKLAEDIGGTGLCNDRTFRRRDGGDGGIDLVAWQDFDPYEKHHIPSLLAQCACSRDSWSAKQTEISRDRLGNYIHPTHAWSQVLFIPHSFRDNRGKWEVEGDIGEIILCDRLRILRHIGDDIDWTHISLPDVFNEALNYRLGIV